MESKMKEVMVWIVAIIAVCLTVYGVYWIAKTFSYWLFYGDMVEETVKTLVKQSCLK